MDATSPVQIHGTMECILGQRQKAVDYFILENMYPSIIYQSSDLH